jgi:thioredoxin-related protein
MKLLFALLLVLSFPLRAQEAPSWFALSLLDLREEVAEAAKEGKRVMVYFGQDGCPYCTRLMEVNFRQQPIVEKMKRHFVAVELNIWGDREVVGTDGRGMSEKRFAAAMKVQYTPTLLFFDEKGGIALRLNGYYPPHQFEAALEYAANRLEKKTPFADYMKTAVKAPASGTLHPEPFFQPTRDLRRKPGGKPLALIFETPDCAGCDEMHSQGLRKASVLKALERFDVLRFNLSDSEKIVSPSGAATTPSALARQLKLGYVPAIVFFDVRGREVFRVESFVRSFHLAGALEYVSSGAYSREPSFQRFLQLKSERMREQGSTVDLWD